MFGSELNPVCIYTYTHTDTIRGRSFVDMNTKSMAKNIVCWISTVLRISGLVAGI